MEMKGKSMDVIQFSFNFHGIFIQFPWNFKLEEEENDEKMMKISERIEFFTQTARESCSLWLLAQGRLLLDAELLRDSLVREDDKCLSMNLSH